MDTKVEVTHIKSTISSNVFLSGDAHRKIREIKESIPSNKVSRPIPYIINKLICDYSRELTNHDDTYLRLFYLWLNLKHSSVWNKGINSITTFNNEASQSIIAFQSFVRRKNFVVDKREIPNVIIHDYIALLQLRNIDIVQHYLNLHT